MNQLQMLKRALIAYVNSVKAIWSILAYPLSIVSKRKGTLKDYRIYGNTVDGQSVGELVTEGEYSGKYRIGVVAKGKNLYKPTRLSAGSISTPSASIELSNGYGTTISTSDATKGEFTVTQTKATSSTAYDYRNGYFCFEIGQKVLTPKSYIISFDCEILNSLIDTNYIGVMPNGGNLALGTVVNGRVKVNFKYIVNGTTDNYIEIRNCGKSLKIGNIMITEVGENTDYESYKEPQTFNIFLDEPLGNNEHIDYGKGAVVRNTTDEEVDLPKLPQYKGTTVYEVDTTVKPSGIQVCYYE